MTIPDHKRVPGRARRGTTLVLGVSALAGVLLVLNPAGAAAAEGATPVAADPATWLGLPLGAVVWIGAGVAVLLAARTIALFSRRARRGAGVLPTQVGEDAGTSRETFVRLVPFALSPEVASESFADLDARIEPSRVAGRETELVCV